MTESDVIARKLENLAEHLAQRGQADLAQEVNSLLAEVRDGREPEPGGGVMTTGEAARLLGVRSVFTVKRWAREGILEGYRRGGRILVSRESVERLLHSPTIAEARAREQAVVADLEPFDSGEEPVPATPWPGRKPWDEHDPTRT